MPVSDFIDWQAFHCLWPIDGSREDYRHAINCQITAAAYGAETEVDDFIPRFGVEQRQQTAEETLAYFRGLANRTKKPEGK